jgi:uncharacterized protein YqeY
MQQKIESDLKAALLSGDKETAETLKGIKSAVMYEAVAKKLDRADIDDETFQLVLAREAKKRQEAADLYKNAGETERAEKELREKAIIAAYLPEQMSDEEVETIVVEEIAKIPGATLKEMGRIISSVRERTSGRAEGGTIARLVKARLDQS